MLGGAQAAVGDLPCGELQAPPAALQVAWVSPLTARVAGGAWLEVVRVAELRERVRDLKRDPVRVLQVLGMLGPKGPGPKAERPYKVTMFDVESSWLCRPIADAVGGEMVAGVAVCEDSQQRPAGCAWRPGFTGCGTTRDTGAGGRGVEVFRLRWEDASARGFCVLPFERFLQEG